MTYEEAQRTKAALETILDQASAALKDFPRGETGLTPDSVKASPEWKKAKAHYQAAFNALRTFNGFFFRTWPNKGGKKNG